MPLQRPLSPALAVLDPIIEALARREQQQAEAEQIATQERKDLAKTHEDQRRWESLFQLQRDQFAASEADRALKNQRDSTLFDQQQADRQVSRLTPGVIAPGSVDMSLQQRAGNAALFQPGEIDMAPPGYGSDVRPNPGVMVFSGTPQQNAAAKQYADEQAARAAAAAHQQAVLDESHRHNVSEEAIARANAARSAASAGQEWVVRDGKVIPIAKGTAQPGDMPYDAKKVSQIDDPNDAKQVTETALSIAQRLKTHPGIGAATGANDIRQYGIPFIPGTQARADFNGLRNQLVAALTLPNLGALKGPMSDKDVAFIKNISTRLGDEKLSEEETKKAIDEAIVFLTTKLGGAHKSEPRKIGRFEVIEEP
jgi:hypothetical protein